MTRVLVPYLALALVLLASQPRADQVVPGDRVVLVDAGGKGTIKIQVDKACSPTWTTNSGNDDIVSVVPESAEGGSARVFKIVPASKDVAQLPGTATTVSITVDGVGPECSDVETYTFEVYVGRKHKNAEKFLKKATATQTKNLKAFVKAQKKEVQAGLDGVLDALQGDLGAEGFATDEEVLAFYALQGLQVLLLAYAALIVGRRNCIFGARQQGNAELFFWSHPAAAGAAFLLGGCGLWDGFLANTLATALAAAAVLGLLYKTLLARFALTARQRGLSFAFSIVLLPLLFAAQAGPAVSLFEEGAAEGNGSSYSGALQVLAVVGLNTPDDQSEGGGDRGRLLVGGLAPDAGDVTVSYRLVGGPELDSTQVAPLPQGVYLVMFPDIASPPDLAPGAYEVTVTQDGQTVTQLVDLPRREN